MEQWRMKRDNNKCMDYSWSYIFLGLYYYTFDYGEFFSWLAGVFLFCPLKRTNMNETKKRRILWAFEIESWMLNKKYTYVHSIYTLNNTKFEVSAERTFIVAYRTHNHSLNFFQAISSFSMFLCSLFIFFLLFC